MKLKSYKNLPKGRWFVEGDLDMAQNYNYY